MLDPSKTTTKTALMRTTAEGRDDFRIFISEDRKTISPRAGPDAWHAQVVHLLGEFRLELHLDFERLAEPVAIGRMDNSRRTVIQIIENRGLDTGR